MIKPLFDEAIHPRNRLQICTILAESEAVDFATLRDMLSISDSSLSKHIKYLMDVGYVCARKTRQGRHAQTWLSLTTRGIKAYRGHIAELRRILGDGA